MWTNCRASHFWYTYLFTEFFSFLDENHKYIHNKQHTLEKTWGLEISVLYQSQKLRKIVLSLYFNQEGINWTHFLKVQSEMLLKIREKEQCTTPHIWRQIHLTYFSLSFIRENWLTWHVESTHKYLLSEWVICWHFSKFSEAVFSPGECQRFANNQGLRPQHSYLQRQDQGPWYCHARA